MFNMYFQFFGLLDIILLTIVYFTKTTFKSEENKIYGWLIITSFIGQILHILSYITIYNMEHIPLINIIVTKSYLIYLVVWISLLFVYICIVTYKYSKEKGIKKKIRKIGFYTFLIDVIVLILLLMLPTYCYRDGLVVYTYGSSVNLIYLISIMYITISVLMFITHFKLIVKDGLKKYIPLFAFVLIGSIVMVIQYTNPSLLLITSCETFITFLMYFTIENPDLQMLKEFHKAREFADEINNEKTEFLFNMSNEIKNPINKINLLSKDILSYSENVKEDALEISKLSSYLIQVVNNILDITDLEVRKIDIQGTKYNVYNLFQSINKQFESKINENIKYNFKYDNSIPEYLYGDSIRMKQVMNILLDNAKTYTKNGFIDVNINSIIKHDICRLIITIEDSGIGMTLEEQEHLFDKEKIYSDETLKVIDDNQNNLGIAKSLVNLMNGSIMVSSEYGKGTIFTIVLDQKINQEEKSKQIQVVEKYEEIYINNDKILLVINNEDLSRKVNKFLKNYSSTVVEVTGGQACLEKLRNKEKYNVILMEEELEKLSCEDTLNKIKDTPGYKIPVIIMTKNKEFGSKERYLEKGFKDIIYLPIKKDKFIETLNQYIE